MHGDHKNPPEHKGLNKPIVRAMQNGTVHLIFCLRSRYEDYQIDN